MKQIILIVLILHCLSACVSNTAVNTAPWMRAPDAEITAKKMIRFKSRAEFDNYRREVYARAKAHDYWWANNKIDPRKVFYAENSEETEVPCESEGNCDELVEEQIVVTGSRVKTPVQSITNTQEAGVDEGDIVKHYKNFLIILQDGRLFVVDTGSSSSDLSLVDRRNVYMSPDQNIWYDELLISDDTLIVTGFDYGEDHTEVTLFQISPEGRLSRGVSYFIDSSDYYSSENYATRLVNNQLIFYTPVELSEYEIDEEIVFPKIRKRNALGETTQWQDLFAITDIHWPIQNEWAPVIHVLSVCPIDNKDSIDCRNMGVVGHAYREFYVTPEHMYLWNGINPYDWLDAVDSNTVCDQASTDFSTYQSVLYRARIDRPEQIEAVHTYGFPNDQFALEEKADSFFASVIWEPMNCELEDYVLPQKIVRIPIERFGVYPGRTDSSEYVLIPDITGDGRENRYSDRHYVLGERQNYWASYPDDDELGFRISSLTVVDLENLNKQYRVPLLHDVQRLELVGDSVVADGYHKGTGLEISVINLSSVYPRVTDSISVPDYFESEGRSHAFNFIVYENDHALFGMPLAVKETHEWYGRKYEYLSDNSDIGFYHLDTSGNLTARGMLLSHDPEESEEYDCELSCYGWYGNARPIFLYDRIFALTGSELIEGVMLNNTIAERKRISIQQALH